MPPFATNHYPNNKQSPSQTTTVPPAKTVHELEATQITTDKNDHTPPMLQTLLGKQQSTTNQLQTLMQLWILIKLLEEINNQFALLLAKLPIPKPSLPPSQPSGENLHQLDALQEQLHKSGTIHHNTLPALSLPSRMPTTPMTAFTLPDIK